jgi:chromosome segregation ATPase
MGSINEQLTELRALRGKNQDVVEHMMERVREEKELFERGLSRYTALRNIFTEQTTKLLDYLGLDSLKLNAGRTRRAIESSLFTKGVRGAMGDFFSDIRRDLDQAGQQANEIHDLMRAMYARFSKDHGVELYEPPPFSILKYRKELERLERAYNQHFNTLWNMASKAKFALMRRFFETVATRVKHVYDIANRDVEAWLKSVMSPLETQVREHQLQLRRRLDSVKRIHRAGDELEERIVELEQQGEALTLQVSGLATEIASIDAIIAQANFPLAANG